MFCYLQGKQKLCHEHLRTRAPIIENERLNSINMSLQFTSSFVRQTSDSIIDKICSTHTFFIYYYVTKRSLVSSQPAMAWRQQWQYDLWAPRIRHSPSPHREQ